MSQSLRQRRIARAEELAAQYPSAAEVLRFFVPIARFQVESYCYTQKALKDQEQNVSFAQPLASEVVERFPEFLSLVEGIGPGPVAAAARELRNQSANRQRELLSAFWTRAGAAVTGGEDKGDGDKEFFARAFLQPYAEFVRERTGKQQQGPTPCLCPFCSRKPGVGVLRPLGDGGQRSLVCSFCLGEWEFRRIVCPGCGEEDHSKLPVYTAAEEFKHVRVECCDSCRHYIKTVDLTRNGLADPVVDEIASIALDLWAQKQGYTKLQVNLMLL